MEELTKMPESQMTLYGLSGFLSSFYFTTQEERDAYILKKGKPFMSHESTVEYLGRVGGRSDVMKISSEGNEKFVFIVDIEGYAVLNKERSKREKQLVWEYQYGELYDTMKAFQERGIVFERDVYADYTNTINGLIEQHKQKKI